MRYSKRKHFKFENETINMDQQKAVGEDGGHVNIAIMDLNLSFKTHFHGTKMTV